MPGPSNFKKKRRLKGKGTTKGHQAATEKSLPSLSDVGLDKDAPGAPTRSPCQTATLPIRAESVHDTMTMASNGRLVVDNNCEHKASHYTVDLDTAVPRAPFIHDPGNGPRVRDVHTFLSSKFFAQPPTLNDPLCAEFAQKEVLEMLMTVLPEEVALILWYNKSRSTSRICPACHRLYRLGETLADHIPSQPTFNGMDSSPQIRREQTMSGLCSPMCFIAASYSYPNAIKSAWGRTAGEMDDRTWEILNTRPPEDSVGDPSLTMLMRMTRLDDLGLGQLCLGLDPEDVQRGAGALRTE